MFVLDGIALDDDVRGWVCRDESQPLTQIDVELTTMQGAGRDGVVPGLQRRVAAPTIVLVVETPQAHEEALRSVFRRAGVRTLTNPTKYPNREVGVELLSLTPTGIGDADAVVEFAAMLRVPGVFWRDDADDTTDPAAISSASVNVSLMTGLSAPVRDSIVRVKGGATGLRVQDSGGAYFEYMQVLASGDYLRFDSATGRAWVTSTDVWTGGTEVSGYIDTGPGPYPLELTPTFTTDPDAREAVLTVTSSARTGSPTIEVRGRRAYEV